MSGSMSLTHSVEFAENPEPRCPCVLLLDTSGSMTGPPIHALNAGVTAFHRNVMADPVASRRVEVAIVTFDTKVQVIEGFGTVGNFSVPVLLAQGFTRMGAGISKALDLIQERKAVYRANGIAYYRPWVLMITDGEPQEEPAHIIEEASRRLKDDEANQRVAFFAVGVQDASMKRLAAIVTRPPVKLQGLNFTEMFVWLSSSMQKVAQSKIDEQSIPATVGDTGEQVALPRPGGSS